MKLGSILKTGMVAAGLLAGAAGSALAQGAPIKVGVLHSLSGTMAISETTLKDVMLMLIEEQNKKGGVLGRKLEAVVVDPASNWPLFAEKARELLQKEKVAAVFGCWTSVSRKSVLPVFEELNGILFYPVQYEGEESSRNVFYTGAAPNQQAIPAVDYLMANEKVQRWVLAGTDYVYPRTTNKILEAYLKQKGVKQEDIMINYTPFGHSDWQSIVAEIKKFGSAGKKTAVVSTINGDANVPFYKELGNAGIKAKDIPVVAFSVGEEELAGIDTKPLLGHLAAWNYFQSVKNPTNEAFIKAWQTFTKNPKRVTNDPMEAHVIGFDDVDRGGEEGRHDGSRQGDRRHDRHHRAEPVGWLLGDDAEPPHHQAGPDRRDPGQRPVRHGVADPGPGGRGRVVALPAGLQGPDRRLEEAHELRQLQRRHRQVRRQGQVSSRVRATHRGGATFESPRSHLRVIRQSHVFPAPASGGVVGAGRGVDRRDGLGCRSSDPRDQPHHRQLRRPRDGHRRAGRRRATRAPRPSSRRWRRASSSSARPTMSW